MIPSVIIITHQSISDSGASSCKINGGSATQEGSCHELVEFRGRALTSEIWKLEYRVKISFEIYILYRINHVKKSFQHSGSSRQGLRQFFPLKIGFPWRTRFFVWQICSTDHVHDPPTFKTFFYMILLTISGGFSGIIHRNVETRDLA